MSAKYELHMSHQGGLISMIFETRQERSEYMEAWGFERVATGVYMDKNYTSVAACQLDMLGAYLFRTAKEAAAADRDRVNA